MKKKLISIIMAVTFVVAAGCGNAQTETQNTADATVKEATENTEEDIIEEASESAEENKAKSTDENLQDDKTENNVENSAETDEIESSDSSEDAEAEAEETTDESEEGKMAEEGHNTRAWQIVSQMTIGWNLGNTLDAHDDGIKISDPPSKQETCWGNPETTQEIIDAVLDMGFNTIRIPITWKAHIDENNKIDEAWMARVQEVVDYAYGRGAYVIINVHHEDWNYPYYDNQDKASEKLSAIWTQVADRFKDYDTHLIFELQNEPRKVGTDLEWNGGDKEGRDVVNAVNMAGYEAIRAADGNNKDRLIMFPGYAASSQSNCLLAIQLPEDDDCVAVSVHAYTPYEFALNIKGRSTYDNDHGDLDRLLSDIKRFFFFKNVPVIIGEYGALNKDNESERVEWVQYYLKKAREMEIPCVWWDNGQFNGDGENFGIIDRRTLELPYPELIKAMQEFK
ncbi:glycoside hydrolase family 5 protein [Butyrivibrio sp. AE3004]|uniref:glycoside hydrolase family 5 protein n=1 Tax=Butyrivibrio sp. AE3004 TaxID=1506994 RepID=UPI0006922345|nr:glycoside hydrolase family 5 protein [Butyrivibrio sp. AE3004]